MKLFQTIRNFEQKKCVKPIIQRFANTYSLHKIKSIHHLIYICQSKSHQKFNEFVWLSVWNLHATRRKTTKRGWSCRTKTTTISRNRSSTRCLRCHNSVIQNAMHLYRWVPQFKKKEQSWNVLIIAQRVHVAQWMISTANREGPQHTSSKLWKIFLSIFEHHHRLKTRVQNAWSEADMNIRLMTEYLRNEQSCPAFKNIRHMNWNKCVINCAN